MSDSQPGPVRPGLGPRRHWPGTPDGTHSPNTLFAASFAQAGFAMEVPSPELFYEFLAVHYASRVTRRGVKIRGLWYDGDALDGYRGTASTRGGAWLTGH